MSATATVTTTTTTAIPTAPTAATHVREQRSLLTGIEKQVLHAIAMRLPALVHPDHLTALGALGMLGAGLSFWAARAEPFALLLVPVFLAVNWFGDSLDGTLARVRNRQRPRYGYYVDHAVDLLGAIFLLGGMAASGFMTPILAVALLAAFFLVMAETFLATHARGVFRMSYGPFGPSELRIVLVLGALRLLGGAEVTLLGRRLLLFDVGGAVAAAGMLVIFLVAAVHNGVALYRAETRR